MPAGTYYLIAQGLDIGAVPKTDVENYLKNENDEIYKGITIENLEIKVKPKNSKIF